MSKYTTLIGSTAITLALLATPAYAQIDDEIIVTATKRETTLQDTPVAVTVTPADVIEKAQILDIKDLQTVVPTFRVSQLQNSANSTLTIRGFGNGGNNIGIEPSVGLFIDGVYRSRAAAQIGDLPKLSRVEVLAGPQSTLFGKNASAGVVSIVTATPDFETNGYIEGGVGNYDQLYAKGYITGGITEDVAISLGGGFQVRDGYFDNAEGTLGSDFNNIQRFNLRGQALFEPNDDFTARLIADMSTINENCCGVAVAFGGPTINAIRALGGDVNFTDGPVLGASVENPEFDRTTFLNSNTPNEIDDKGISLNMDYTKGDLTFTSITAFRKNEQFYDSDSDFTTLELLRSTFQGVDIDTFTQELRVASNFDAPVNFLLGGFYFDEEVTQNSGLVYGNDLRNYIDALIGNTATLGAIEATSSNQPGTFFAGGTTIDEVFEQDNKAFSIFGTVDYEVTDRLTLTGGLSYTEDKKDVTGSTINNDVFSNIDLSTNPGTALVANGAIVAAYGNPNDPISQAFAANFMGAELNAQTIGAIEAGLLGTEAQAGLVAFRAGVRQNIIGGLAPLQFQPQFLAFPNSVESGRTKDDDITWSVRGSYEINDSINVYASAATGFKASSWNVTRDSRPFLTDGPALADANLLPNNYNVATGRNFGTRFAGPEEATVYELGLKTKFDKGFLNVSVFDQTIKGFQSTIFQGTGFVLANAGSQSTQGFEFDSSYSPVESLTLTLAGILQDPVYDDYTGAPGPNGTVVDLSGEQPAGINEVAVTASATYSHDFANGAEAFIRGEYQYEDEVQIVDNIVGLDRDTSVFNGSIGYTTANGLGIRFWGRNLFDHETYTSGFPGVVQAGTVQAYPNQPRTYGVAVRKEF